MYQAIRRTIAAVLVGPVLALGMPVPGHAEIVGAAPERADRARIEALVERGLIGHGVDPARAKARAQALTDEEVRRVAGEIEKLPAGGDDGWILLLPFIIIAAALLILALPFYLLVKAIEKSQKTGTESPEPARTVPDGDRPEPATY